MERTGPLGPPIYSMEFACKTVRQFMDENGCDLHGKEYFCVVLLDARNQLIGVDVVATGTINEVTPPVREIFLSALVAKASKVAFVHNHPSGHLSESAGDIALAQVCSFVAKALGIEVLGNGIVTDGGWRAYGVA